MRSRFPNISHQNRSVPTSVTIVYPYSTSSASLMSPNLPLWFYLSFEHVTTPLGRLLAKFYLSSGKSLRYRPHSVCLPSLIQCSQGLQYMHELRVAHRYVRKVAALAVVKLCMGRDCTDTNIMFDPRPMYPQMFHPRTPKKSLDYRGSSKHSTRTACPVRYYFIDFGLSRRYNPEDGPPRAHPIRGGDKAAPEFKAWNGELLDPFPTDVYYVGNAIQQLILEVRRDRHCLACIGLLSFHEVLPRDGFFGSPCTRYDPARPFEETDNRRGSPPIRRTTEMRPILDIAVSSGSPQRGVRRGLVPQRASHLSHHPLCHYAQARDTRAFLARIILVIHTAVLFLYCLSYCCHFFVYTPWESTNCHSFTRDQ